MRKIFKVAASILARIAPGWHPLRLGPLRKAVMWLIAVRRPETLDVNHGFKLRIPKGDRSPYVYSLYVTGEYAPEESRLIAERLTSGDVAFDVGANVGYMTCLMARAVGARGQVYAFEPEPTNFRVLSENITLNGLDCVVPYRVALSNRTGKEFISLANENRGDHTLVELAGREQLAVDTVTFDESRETHCAGRAVRLVKIDVQGYELEVLEGMKRSLQEGAVDTVLLEFWPARVRRPGAPSADVLALLQRVPYDVNIVSDTGVGGYSTLEELAAACPAMETNPHHHLNLVLTRRGT